MVSPARAAAYETVFRVFEQDAYADRALRTAVASLDQRDRAFAQRLAYGTIQRVRTLDYAIEQLGRRPVRKLDPPVRAALRSGPYELGFMQTPRTPPSTRPSSSFGRQIGARGRFHECGASPRRGRDRSAARIVAEGALKLSYPDWVEEVWTRDFGREQALALMRAQNEAPETVVRLIRGEIEGEPTDIPRRLSGRASA
jgi:16S rRNA (cytosine967-C5)-methyltransferase